MSKDTTKYGEPDLQYSEQRIREKQDEFKGPNAGWDKMDQRAQQEHKKYEESIPSGPNEGNPQQELPESEKQKHVIGTESTHY